MTHTVLREECFPLSNILENYSLGCPFPVFGEALAMSAYKIADRNETSTESTCWSSSLISTPSPSSICLYQWWLPIKILKNVKKKTFFIFLITEYLNNTLFLLYMCNIKSLVLGYLYLYNECPNLMEQHLFPKNFNSFPKKIILH